MSNIASTSGVLPYLHPSTPITRPPFSSALTSQSSLAQCSPDNDDSSSIITFHDRDDQDATTALLSTMREPTSTVSDRARPNQHARTISLSHSLGHMKIPKRPRSKLRIALGGGALIWLVVVLWNRSQKGVSSPGLNPFGVGSHLQTNARGKVAVDFEVYEVPNQWKCNPFKEFGKLEVDTREATNNVWIPYDDQCSPSTLMRGVMTHLAMKRSGGARAFRQKPLRAADSSRPLSRVEPTEDEPFPWLVNATIILHGDSMERLHNNDWCEFVGGDSINVTPEHPLSPPTVRKEMPTILGPDGKETEASIEAKQQRIAMEDWWATSRGSNWIQNRPWVCNLKEYNATLISVFAWGLLQDMEEVYKGEEFFHSPSTWIERFDQILLPLMKNVATQLDRPHVLQPTLIELSAGFWDLRAMTELDFLSQGIPRPYPMDNPLPFGPIGSAREQQWARNMREAIKHVARAFPSTDGVRDGPPIMFRSLHNPKRNNYTPYTRAFALDQLIRKTIHDLRVESLATHPTVLGTVKTHLTNTWKAGKSGMQERDFIDYGLDERLRVDEIGPLLRGQDDHFKDFLHPNPIPGSYLWGDIMLYELKRAVARVGRTFS